MRPGLVAAITLLMAAGLACSKEVRNDTLIVLEVDSDLVINDHLTDVEINVTSGSGAMVSRSFRVTTAAALPVKLALVPEGDPGGAFTATVVAKAGVRETARQVVSTRFVPNQARRLLVFLSRLCLGAVCPAPQTCRTGPCVAPSDGVVLVPLADGGVATDARPADSAPPTPDGPDARVDVSPGMDTSPADLPPAVDLPPVGDVAPPVDVTIPPPDTPPPPCGAAGQACCAAGAPCQGALSCSAGMCSCAPPGLMCGGACVNRMTDARHCGACNHDCLGGTCAMGTCAPVTIAPVQENPVNLAIDASNLYFRRGSGASGIVARLPKTTGAAVANLAINQNGQGTMLSDDTRLYFFANRQVNACALPACAGGPQLLAATMPTTTLGIDIIHLSFNLPRSRLFWSDHTRIISVATTGGVTRNHFTNNMQTPVALDSDFLYFVNAATATNPNRTMLKLRIEIPPALEPIVELPPAEATPRQMIMTPGRLFWQTASAITALPIPEPAGTAIPPAFAGGPVSTMFVEGTTIFWGSGNTVRSCPVAGCAGAPRTVVTAPCPVREVVADARAVYWICGNAELMKVAR